MDTLEFLNTILPPEGIKYLALIDSNGRVAHKSFASLQDMAAAVMQWDTKNLQVYHACGSYLQEFVQTDDGKKKYRVPSNQNKAKAFWLDIDCGQDKADKGDGYVTKKDAVAALKQFCAQTKLPTPMIVDSGYGIHCYWVLTKPIPVAAWAKVAVVLKAVVAHFRFLADPTATADFARILRPVGATNKKHGNTKTVTVKHTAQPIEPQEFVAILNAVKSEVNLTVTEQKAPVPSINDDLIAHLPPSIPSYATEVANRCAQVAAMRDTQGDVNYEHWRGVIGIIKYCEEGVALAHEWSARRAETGHAQCDTDTKYNTWSSPPTTCEFFSKCNPTACAECPHKGKVKTPLILGRIEPTTKTTEVEAQVDGTTMQVQVPEFPKGYGLDGSQMARYMQDKDGILHAFNFCNNLFYPIHRIRKESGDFSLGMRMHLPDMRTREFEIDTQLLASPQRLVEGLAKYELIPTNSKDASMHMTAYLRDSLEKLKREAEELNTYTSFGWKEDYQAFLMGDRLYHRDGSVRKVLVGGYAKDMASAFPTPKGTSEGYAKALNYLYARQGMEPMQYAIAAGFGSVLTPLGDTMYKGLTMAITGGDTAKGKTTVCWSALYAFGDADKMSLKTEDNATVNARYARMGAYRNLPMLIDELTNIDPEEFSKFAYTVSLGQERERLTVGRGNTGIRFAEAQNWALSLYVTANKDLHASLAVRQSNTQAEAVRLIQIKIDRYTLPTLTISEVEAAKKQMFINKGCAGAEFVAYVVANLDSVMETMVKWGKRIEEDVADVKYRFYRSHAICSLSAMEVTNKLGITNFDLEALYTFVLGLFKELAEEVTEQNTITSEDALNRMLNDISSRVLVTTEYRDGRDSRGPEDVRNINGVVSGRYIVGNVNTKNDVMSGKIYIIRKEITDWCLKNRVDYKTMMGNAIDKGIAVEVKDKFNIGRGTKVSAGQHRCVELDMNKLESVGTAAPKLTVYTNKRIEGSEVANE